MNGFVNIPPLPAHADSALAAMSPDELMQLMIDDEDRVPRNVVDECASRGAAMVERLQSVVGSAVDWDHPIGRGEWWLRLHAAFILGLIQDEAAGLLLVQLMRRLADGADDDLEDWLAGYWPALFRNKPDEVMQALDALAQAHHQQSYMRSHVLETMLALAGRAGDAARDAMIARIAACCADSNHDLEDRLLVASLLLDFPRLAHRAVLDRLVGEQRGIWPHFGSKDVDAAYARGRDQPGWLRFDDPWKFYKPIQIEARQRRWRKEDRRAADALADVDFDSDPWMGDLEGVPCVRETPKIGRNDPCPCGSGKKYKKCCLRGAE